MNPPTDQPNGNVKKRLYSEKTCDTLLVKRADLEAEHSNIMARVQYLRKLLGLPPLATGDQLRKMA